MSARVPRQPRALDKPLVDINIIQEADGDLKVILTDHVAKAKTVHGFVRMRDVISYLSGYLRPKGDA